MWLSFIQTFGGIQLTCSLAQFTRRAPGFRDKTLVENILDACLPTEPMGRVGCQRRTGDSACSQSPLPPEPAVMLSGNFPKERPCLLKSQFTSRRPLTHICLHTGSPSVHAFSLSGGNGHFL